MGQFEDKDKGQRMKICPLCSGQLEERTITYPQRYEGNIIILENVPAEVCGQCGEILIRPEVLERLQGLVWSSEEPKRTAQVPVFDFAEAS